MNGTIEQLPVRACGSKPLVAWTDEKLLLSYRSSPDEGVFEELVHRYEKELYGYLRHYLGDAEMAADVFQQTFLQIHLKCGQFEPGRKVRPWLYTIATNQAIDYQRRNRRHRMSSLDRVSSWARRKRKQARWSRRSAGRTAGRPPTPNRPNSTTHFIGRWMHCPSCRGRW